MPMGIRDMQFQSFSLRHQKILINFNVFSSGSSDILLKGVLYAEFLILVDNLNAFYSAEDGRYVVSAEKVNHVTGLDFNKKTINQIMREACDLSFMIDTDVKQAAAPMIDEIQILSSGDIAFKLTKSFDFFRNSLSFKSIYEKLPYRFTTSKLELPQIGQQIMLIA